MEYPELSTEAQVDLALVRQLYVFDWEAEEVVGVRQAMNWWKNY
jgi:hypothetical protein